MANIVVLNKQDLATLQDVQSPYIVLNQASIVQVSYAKEDIASIVRYGTKVIITLKTGEKVVIESFFNADGSSVHDLVLLHPQGQLELVKFDATHQVIEYNPIASIQDLPTSHSSSVAVGQTTTLEASDQAAWVKPALIFLGAEAVYLTAFNNDNDDKKEQDILPPVKPTATIDEQGKVITGKTEAKAKVYAKDTTGKILAETTADAEGNYTLNLNREVVNGERVDVYAKDDAGNESQKTTIAGNKDTLAPEAPQAQINDTGNIVSGKAEVGAKIFVYANDGTTLLAGPIQVANDGSFSIVLSQTLGQTVQAKVIAVDAAGNRSEAGIVIVGQDTIAPEKAAVEVNAAGTVVKGLAEAYAIVEIKDAQGKLLASTHVKDNGTFEVNLPTAMTDTSNVLLVVKDAAGNSSESIALKPNLDLIAPEAVVAQINSEGTIVSGQAEANSKIEIYAKDNTLLASGQADSTGQFSLNLSKALENNSTASVYAIDSANNQSIASTVIGSKDTIAPNKVILQRVLDDVGESKGTINANQVTDDTQPQFEGTGEKGATLVIYNHGVAIDSVAVDSSGKWTYTPKDALNEGLQSFSFTQIDTAGNSSEMSSSFSFTVSTVQGASLIIDQTDDGSLDDVLSGLLGEENPSNPEINGKGIDNTAYISTASPNLWSDEVLVQQTFI